MGGNALDYQAPVDTRGSLDTTVRLSLMMFLEFFVWGAWYVTTYPFMSEMAATTGVGGVPNAAWTDAIPWAYTLCPIAAIISPLFLGIVADRYFSSERVLGALHLIGAIAMFAAPAAAQAGPGAFIAVLMVHALCYMPTLGLTNSIAFHNITNQEKQFPLIRVLGTIGWIVAGLVVSLGLKADKTALQYHVTGIAGVALALVSFLVLPHTPPPAKGKKASVREILGVDALALMKDRSFLVFMVCSFLICIPLAFYYKDAGGFVGDTGVERVAAVMSIGQGAEIVFMLIMPLFFVRLGVKWMLAMGMLAWVLRYGLFAMAAPDKTFWMIVTGIALHGICYDFFFVTGFIYTDKRCSKEIRGQAQGLLVLVTQGLGLGLGAQLSGWVKKTVMTAKPGESLLPYYQKFWAVPCLFALAVLVIFVLLFKYNSKNEVPAENKVVA